MQPSRRPSRSSAGLAVWLAAGLLTAGVLTALPLSWGTAHGQTAPAPPAASPTVPSQPPAPPEPPAPPALAPTTEPVIVRLPFSAVGTGFVSFARSRDALRTLGQPLSRPTTFAGMNVQYFEKGRIEDHSAFENDPNWKVMYGLLVDELMAGGAKWPIGGEESTLTYADLVGLSDPAQRTQPPAGFSSGVTSGADGAVFVPFDAKLQAAPGHPVPARFWAFMQRPDIFPGGWLHDLGLPITAPASAVVRKGGIASRQIQIQAFQRGILTFDPANPSVWQVELANVGTDYIAAFPSRVFSGGEGPLAQ